MTFTNCKSRFTEGLSSSRTTFRICHRLLLLSFYRGNNTEYINLLPSFASFVIVSGSDFIKIRNQLVKCFSIDHQTTNSTFVIGYNISCSQIIAENSKKKKEKLCLVDWIIKNIKHSWVYLEIHYYWQVYALNNVYDKHHIKSNKTPYSELDYSLVFIGANWRKIIFTIRIKNNT